MTTVLIIGSALLVVAAAALVTRRALSEAKRARRELYAVAPRVDALVRSLTSVQVPALETLPLPDLKLDFEQSPFTGMTRKAWQQVGEWMLENALRYAPRQGAPLMLPRSRAAPLPRLGLNGQFLGAEGAEAEAFARTFTLAAPLLRANPELTLAGFHVADHYAEWLLRGIQISDEAYFGRADATVPSQVLVEGAAICVALATCREAVWERLTAREQDRVLDWLELMRSAAVVDNNWRWFPVIVNAFLGQQGRDPGFDQVGKQLSAIDAFYCDAGWFRDGSRFDFYSSWCLQYYPIWWVNWAGDHHPAWRDRFLQRNDAFLETFPHLFSRHGEMPMWGRSICYRFAATAAVAATFHRPDVPSISPGFARRLCSGNMLQFVRVPGFLRSGLIPLGFHGEQPHLIDSYSCTASPYWCTTLFTALGLPEDHPFWTSREELGFWNDPPERVDIGDTGMWAEHDAETGHTKLFAPGNGSRTDPRYSAPHFDTSEAVYSGVDLWGQRGHGPPRNEHQGQDSRD